jgi:uncharacterized membrane protein YdbT with pleckstrin-like domain
MPYPQKNLNANETIALDMHPHWWYFAEPVASVIGAIVLGVLVMIYTDSGSGTRTGVGWLAIVLLGVTAVWLVIRYFKWITTNFVVTSHRMIFRHGVFAKSGIEIPLERVNNVNFNQGIFERMVGAGDLLIESGGEEGQQRFTDIRHPDQVQNLINAEMEGHALRRATLIRDVATGGSSDVAGQLEKLEGMLQRGTLTQDEFEAQKRKLIG